MPCKIYCFAFQKRLFCTVKVALLQRKTGTIAKPKYYYRFLLVFFFTNKRVALLFSFLYYVVVFEFLKPMQGSYFPVFYFMEYALKQICEIASLRTIPQIFLLYCVLTEQ